MRAEARTGETVTTRHPKPDTMTRSGGASDPFARADLAGGSRFTSDRRLRRWGTTRPLGPDHQRHRGHDDPATDDDRPGHLLIEDQPAEEHRDHRVDVGVRRDE